MPAPYKILAKAFAKQLQSELRPGEWDAVLHRNATEDYAGNICASHDFCDANMVMAEAFERVTGHEVDLQSDQDLNLWNQAWDHAKQKYLTRR